jgi:penicillin-binding protein 1B
MKRIKLFPESIRQRCILILSLFVLAGLGKLSFLLHGVNSHIANTFPRSTGSRCVVFARGLTLQSGDVFSPDDLEQELQLLQFRKRSVTDYLNSYKREGDQFTLFSPDIEFAGDNEAARLVHITFVGQHVGKIVDLSSGKSRNAIQLKPLRLGTLSQTENAKRQFLSLGKVPDFLKKAIIAVEDQSFASHHGVDFKAILRALYANIHKGAIVQGGSTITQQLARHLFFTREQTVTRKINETLAAFVLESRLSKDEILEAYINEVYLGQDGNQAIKGFSAAAQHYFGRTVPELEIGELALLVGMLKGPSFYNPRKYPDRTKSRRDLVLRMMEQEGMVSFSHAQTASRKEIILYESQKKMEFPAFIDLVRSDFSELYKKNSMGASEDIYVFSSFDPLVQLKVEEGVVAGFKRIEERHKTNITNLEVGVVVVSLKDSKVISVVGGRNFRFDGFNRAIDARRPIGSLIKPVYFLAALEQPERFNVMTELDNSSISIELGDGVQWAPSNYSSGNSGKVPLYKALAHSYNTASVRLGLEMGIEHCLSYLAKFGFEEDIQSFPSVLLGAISMSPVEVAGIYNTLGAAGLYRPLRSITSIYDRNLEKMFEYADPAEQRFDKGSTYLLNTILQKAVSEGTVGSRKIMATKGLQAAGKTGTTDDLRDSWFAGFTGDTLVVVWMGKDRFETAGLTGGQGAFIVWDEIMGRISHSPFKPEVPDNVTWLKVDSFTGSLIEEQDCETVLDAPYITDFVPTRSVTCQESKYIGQHKDSFNQWLQNM